MNRADLSKQPEQVSAMFDDVSTNYDRMNAMLSVGNDTLWRIVTTRTVGSTAGERVLDLAAGTGTSSASLAKNGAHVVAADFSPGMIAVGREKYRDVPNIEFVEADATKLPFADAEFDATTISFGLRNVVRPKDALAEMFRVTKPGGRIVICEFSTPVIAPMRAAYNLYLERVMPIVAGIASSNADAYTYLNDSIRAWPMQQELAGWLREAGYERVAYRNLTGGIVALHRGVKPL
ncbi:bifunctional demethylmenaquinone methyltransferase/2-methoxy-6-polyprenyl-1,4-benzoquinol methylase UbiE [Plantibacter sp. YIM 135347]|uniref:bifunctional demethylmenaquinone methyltransferase/2-methoxy-6-polyprenyl-1,4-benzoquinol methylase UbiE n=1 Tax=Plantibacter sp. YIM 135347 TaxID=3423919 RepID=UPI003D33B529